MGAGRPSRSARKAYKKRKKTPTTIKGTINKMIKQQSKQRKRKPFKGL